MRERIPGWIKTIVEIEKGAVCGICDKPIKFRDEYEIDHIYPVSRGGSNSLDNLHVVHKNCNRKKGANKIMTSPDQWKQWWNLIEPNLSKLRDNQKEAIEYTVERMTNLEKYPNEEYRILAGGRPKIYCECTAAGKSILMIVLGFLLTHKRILIVVPSRVIKSNNFEALTDAYKLGIIPQKVLDEVKIIALDKSALAYIHTADIVISTYQKLGKEDSERVLANLRGDEFDVILVDEGHHYRDDDFDTTHQDIIKKFKKHSIILFFTATPFKGDVARLDPMLKDFDKAKDVIHEFSYSDAWNKGYVKYPEWTEIKPEQQLIHITHPNGKTETQALTLKEAEKLDGYKKALPQSEAIKLSLLYATLHLLDQRNDDLRGRAKKNIALMVFQTIKEAEGCAKILDGLRTRYKYCVVHSKVTDDTLIEKIKNDAYDIILSVAMFKEGFSQSNITIVTLCRNITSYVFFTQVIGRGARARKDIHGNWIPVSGPARHTKDISYIVTHESFKLIDFWTLFRELDLCDLVDEQEQREESEFLFEWGSVPGNDSSRLLGYLESDHDINIDNAKIIKTDDDKTIKVFTDAGLVEFSLNENKDNATLKFIDGQTEDLPVEKESSGNVKIYKKKEKKFKEIMPKDIDYIPSLVNVLDETVTGYTSEGFDDGRTYRDETTAYYFKEFIKTSRDPEMIAATEKFYNKDEGKDMAKVCQKIRSREFVDTRNPSAPLTTETADPKAYPKKESQLTLSGQTSAAPKKDLQRETTDKAEILAQVLRRHISKSLKRGYRCNWAKLGKIMYKTFRELYKHPLKGGASKTGYPLTPKDIEFINNEVPKLVEMYRSYDYFKKTFLLKFKENLEMSERVIFIE